MFIRLRRVPARIRTRSGACTSDTYMRIAPTLTSADVNTSPDTWAALGLDPATTARRTPTRDSAKLHPCRQAAFFLPCASRPPDACILRFARPRRHYGPNSRRAYVTTRAGTEVTDTMARSRQETNDEITEADDTADAATFGGSSLRGTRQVTPSSMTDDLSTALAMPPHLVPSCLKFSHCMLFLPHARSRSKTPGTLIFVSERTNKRHQSNHSPLSHPSACLAPVRTSTKGLPFQLVCWEFDGLTSCETVAGNARLIGLLGHPQVL
jgi:hypothetical protein